MLDINGPLRSSGEPTGLPLAGVAPYRTTGALILTEEKESDVLEQHVKRYEKKLKTVVVVIALIAFFIVWFMMHQ